MGEAKSERISLKLLVDRNENRVIFAEAGKDFVDFLFHFLSLPVGTVVKLLSKDKMVGSLGKIHESIEAMHANYMEPNVNKEYVLNPKVLSGSLAYNPFKDDLNEYVLYYCGTASHLYVSSDPNAQCPYNNGNLMNTQMKYLKSTAEGKASGYVNGVLRYMVMDNLEVKPLISTIPSINLLKELVAHETVEVFIGKEEAIEMLRASFRTDKVLTSLFLDGNKKE